MLSKKYKAKESEPKWQDFWQEEEIYAFDPDSDQKIYSIDTPPPTVNGKIHIGHIFSYSQADMIARYYRMKGYNVFYPFGFDDNGLPTERLVERVHGIKAHDTTREHFNELCLEETARLEEQFKKLFISAGFSCDWDQEYSTISPRAQKISQKSFLDLYNKGKVYFAKAPALWCPECQTAIAQAELETKDIPSFFNYLKFFIDEEGNEDDYIEIATTRPELLAACQAIFVHPDDEKNAHLIGKKVRVPLYGFSVPVMADELVEKDKGTGVVMSCTFGDLTDLEWYKKHHLDFKEVIQTDGTLSELAGKYAGMKIPQARKQIIEDLDEQGHLIRKDRISHNVAVHERCGTPMEITIKNQWFIDILNDKQKYLDAGNEINWYPPYMKNRYDNWVENLEWDWGISRQRYFGVPFPVWYCKDCGEVIVAQEDELPVNPLTDRPKHHHCHCHDGECECRDGEFEIIPETDVMDTWATSSVTPQINLHWEDDEKFREDMIPMGLRPNAHDIIRTWDFYTIVKSLYHHGMIPWKDVMISGHVMAGKGEKISKKKGNAQMEPEELINAVSADSVRLWTASGSLGSDIAYSQEEFKNNNKLLTKIWNAAKFMVMQLEGFDKKDAEGNPVPLIGFNPEEEVELEFSDRWILAAYNDMLRRYEDYLQKYEIGLALNELKKFFWNYCDNYIEIVKDRLYKPEIYGENARKSGLYAAYHTLLGLLKAYAIYIPHLTEEIYQGYFRKHEGGTSIHRLLLEPAPEPKPFTEQEEKIMDAALKVISDLRGYKTVKGISLNSPIESITIIVPEGLDLTPALGDIRATATVSNIELVPGEELEVKVHEA